MVVAETDRVRSLVEAKDAVSSVKGPDHTRAFCRSSDATVTFMIQDYLCDVRFAREVVLAVPCRDLPDQDIVKGSSNQGIAMSSEAYAALEFAGLPNDRP